MQPLPSRPLRGIVPPVVTPLVDDELDLAGLQRLLQRLLAGGVHGLFILGTTGEGPLLSYSVRRTMIDEVCKAVAGRLPVLVGVTDTSLAESIDMARYAEAAGADAVVFAPPCYLPISQHDLARGARRLADESPLPVMLYNIPALTKTEFEIETVKSLLAEPNLVGLKDSSGSRSYFRQLLKVARERPDWTLMTGPEHLLAESVALGGDGGICGGANVFPKLFVELFEASVAGDTARVDALQEKVHILDELYHLSPDKGACVIQGVKAALDHEGVCGPQLCSPCAALPEPHGPAVADILTRVGAPCGPPAGEPIPAA